MDLAATPIARINPARGQVAGREREQPSNAPGNEPDTQKPSATGTQDTLELSPDARRELAQLQARDKQVRAHEAAHMAAGGGIVRGGATFTTKQGPDGQMYAVGGEVSIDATPVPNDPSATMAKAQQIQAAAMAPADPSAQDRKVAADAARMAAQASLELGKQKGASIQTGVAGLALDLLG